MYGKIIDGTLQYAPRKIKEGNSTTYNPTAETLEALGYKPIVYTEQPQTEIGYTAECSWIDEGEQITQVWTIIECDLSAEEIAEALAEVLS